MLQIHQINIKVSRIYTSRKTILVVESKYNLLTDKVNHLKLIY